MDDGRAQLFARGLVANMPSDQDSDYPLRALSARVSVMEIALGAMAPMDPAARAKLIQDFDALADALLGQYLAEAVDESYIHLLEKSIEDIRAYLGGHGHEQNRTE